MLSGSGFLATLCPEKSEREMQAMNSITKLTVALCAALLASQAVFAQTVRPDPKLKVAQGTGTEGAAAGTAGGTTAGGTATGAATTATGAAAGGGFGVGTLAISGAMAATIAATGG